MVASGMLIAGDDKGHSDALLGIFDAIAPAASAILLLDHAAQTDLLAGAILALATIGLGCAATAIGRSVERTVGAVAFSSAS